jgi:O-antigen/teichoic acid export membrane protein
MNYFVIACSIIFIFVMCFLEYFKYFLRDESYYEGLRVVPVLLLANLCLGVYYNLTIWYKLTDKTLFGSYISVMGAAITIALNYFLIPRIGYMGSAWATLACYASMMLASFFSGQKFYRVPYHVPKFIFCVGCALLIGWLCNPWYHQLFISSQVLYVLASALTTLLFVGIVFFVERKSTAG